MDLAENKKASNTCFSSLLVFLYICFEKVYEHAAIIVESTMGRRGVTRARPITFFHQWIVLEHPARAQDIKKVFVL